MSGGIFPLSGHGPRKSPLHTSACHTYDNTNQGVVSVVTFLVGGVGDLGTNVSEYVCAEIGCPPWQLNGGCIEGYCPRQ